MRELFLGPRTSFIHLNNASGMKARYRTNKAVRFKIKDSQAQDIFEKCCIELHGLAEALACAVRSTA